jgi:uncharacterized membrane protein (UPF0127 family)
MRVFVPVAVVLLLSACSNRETSEALGTTAVILPNGKQIRAEVLTRPEEIARGMMFRDDLAADRGMLFVHAKPERVSYWMYNVKVPLDMVFIDSSKRVLGVVANVPPCKTRASECPVYGGFDRTRYVLEMRAGEAARAGIAAGTSLTF